MPTHTRRYRILCNVMQSDWSVHFIDHDGQTRIGPWILLDTHEEVLEILRWGEITEEELEDHNRSIRRWGFSSAELLLTDAKRAQLLRRAIGWPWNGYELKQLKAAGRYPAAPKLT